MAKKITEEKASDFLDAYTVVNEDGKKIINIVPAINEIYTRLKVCMNEIRSMQEAIGDICQWGDVMDKRVKELEGKKTIEVVSPEQAKIILK